MKKEQFVATPEIPINKEHFISRTTLRERAAELRGLSLIQNDEVFCLSGETAKLPLNEGFKKVLPNFGFNIDEKRTDNIVTITFLEKYNNGYDYWNIKKSGKPLFVLPAVNFHISDKDRSILLQPYIKFSDGTIMPARQRADNKMAEAIVSYYPEAPSILKEMVKNDFIIKTPWEDIKAAGVRTLSQLFDEWAGDNEPIKNLASSNVSVFHPSPYNFQNKEIRYSYLPERLHGNLFTQWEKQLDNFKRSLP